MGGCLSCNPSSQQQHNQNHITQQNPKHQHNNKNKKQWTNNSCLHSSSSSTSSSSFSNNHHQDQVPPVGAAESSSGVGVEVGLRSGMRDGESGPHHHQQHRLNPTPEQNSTSSTIIKGDKKNFYSRIPPIGRSSGGGGSNNTINNTLNTEHHKGNKDKASATSSIKDNNNAYSESKIAALFEHYKDEREDAVLAEGIERLCKDLEVKPEDFKMLVLAWKFDAEQMCRFSRQEFFQGMKELKTDTLPGIQARLPDIVTQVMADTHKFKDLYRFSFKFGLESELSQRILPIDMATSLWRVVFSQREPHILERWITFLESNPGIRGIPRDTWNMFLNLVETVGSDLSNYDDTEAWPSLFDDFVEFENDALNQNTISNSDGKPTSTSSPPTNNHAVVGVQRLSPH